MSQRSPYISEQLIKALQNAVMEVEASSAVSPVDPALIALKTVVLRRIADLDRAKSGVASLPQSPATVAQLAAIEVPTEPA
jgi:hypothetical protein